MINTLIIPDIHCRGFWKKPVYEILEQYPNTDIVFLGDYLDPYDFEWENNDKPLITGFENLVEISKLAKKHKNIHLLIGNHDASYIGPIDVCYARHDYKNNKRNRDFFWNNYTLFDIAFEKIINNKDFVFSHAGYLNDWIEGNKLYFEPVIKHNVNLCDFLNNNFQLTFKNNGDNKEFDYFWGVMRQYDRYRGGFSHYGSIIWNDVRTHILYPDTDKIQVFAHTYLQKVPAISINNVKYCLDSQQCFYVDENADVRQYNNNEIVPITEKLTKN